MTVYGDFGVFQGGTLTKQGTNIIELSSHKIRLANGQMTGNGTPPGSDIAKYIVVSFGHAQDSTIYQRAATMVPQFYLQIGVGTSNTCWIYYDTGIDDMGIQLGATPPAAGTVIFGKLTWISAVSLSGINISYTERTESYIAESVDVTTAENLYWDGQRWIAGAKNRPLVNLSIVAQVLESESLYLLGEEYFMTQCKKLDIKATGPVVRVSSFDSFARKPGNIFAVYDTKHKPELSQGTATVNSANEIEDLSGVFTIRATVGGQIRISHNLLVSPVTATILTVTDTTITFDGAGVPSLVSLAATYEILDDGVNPDPAVIHEFVSVISVQGQTIYIQLEKTSGIPLVSTTYNPATHYLVATGTVDSLETDLSNVEWYIVNNLGGLSENLEHLARHLRSLHSSGFMNKVVLEEVAVDDVVRLKSNVLNVDGYFVVIPDTEIDLGAAPLTGARQDFVYVEIYKTLAPWPILSYEIKVINDIDFDVYLDPFTQAGLIENVHTNPYVYHESGYYRAVDPNNESDGYSYAIPLLIVHRFNQGGFNISTNRNGGVIMTRPDNKVYNRINLEEVEITAPVILKRDTHRVFASALKDLLTGQLNTRLMPSLMEPTLYSRSPLQIDSINGTGPIFPYGHVGKPDNIRTLWSTNYSLHVPMYAKINENVDNTSAPGFACVGYDTDTKLIIIQVPTLSVGEIVRDGSNQPLDIEVRWVSTGLPVVMTGLWSTGLPNTSSNSINTLDVNYIPGGDISIYFKIKYTENVRQGLSKIPAELLSASLNGLTTLPNSFAMATDLDSSPRFVREMSGSNVVNSITYPDKLYIKRMGENNKFYTYEYHTVRPGNGVVTSYTVPGEISDSGTYEFVGVLGVVNGLTQEVLEIVKIEWDYISPVSTFTVQLADAISPTTPLVFIMAVAGDANKQIDLNLGSLAVSHLSTVGVLSENASTSASVTQPDRPDGIYRFSTGHLIYGVSSCNMGAGMQLVAWVGEDMVPCSYTGIGKNLLEIDLTQADITNFNVGNWTETSPGVYRPDNGAQIRIIVLQPYMLDGNTIQITYKYAAAPFLPFSPTSGRYLNDGITEPNLNYPATENCEIIHRGYLLLSNDGVANERGSFASPFSERFPEVQGIEIVGKDVDSGVLGWNDILLYQQLNQPFVEGQELTLDGSLVLNTNVVPETGQVVYAALIKQLNILRMFLYVLRDGPFIMNNPEQAFVCELDQNYREVVR